jgi:hypothetical protein
LLIEARERDPRSVAARYLYADTVIRQGKIADGLAQMAIISRLLPGASVQLVPALAEYAHSPGSADELKKILATNPQLKKPLLFALAADPDNLALVIRLAGDAADRPGTETSPWKTRLLNGLVARGDYQRAYYAWRQFAGLSSSPPPLLFNGEFRDVEALAPFNWSFTASPAGVADVGPGGLQVLYYGRDDASLASQLLLLPSSRYRFGTSMSGSVVPGALSWSLTCVGANAPLMELNLQAAGESAAAFSIPASGCTAQWLQLNGHSKDSPEDSNVRIRSAQIQKLNP